ncbi:hypothetical protein ACFB49_22980 [Sphingomonas sp. DBB INV C78]|uniref:hypothetical protein n=1 Tax=Sphingomonas sp. DBB INV C78 TaxID=3349434 RepID=UPI0036D28549
MSRIDPSHLAHDLEIALATAPHDLTVGLLGSDRRTRSAAVSRLAFHLADRLSCYEFTLADEPQADDQPRFF